MLLSELILKRRIASITLEFSSIELLQSKSVYTLACFEVSTTLWAGAVFFLPGLDARLTEQLTAEVTLDRFVNHTRADVTDEILVKLTCALLWFQITRRVWVALQL